MSPLANTRARRARRACSLLLRGHPALRASACALLALACTSTDPTEIVGGVTTQIKVPDYLRSVGLTVQVGGEVKFCDAYPVTNGSTTLPATLGVLGSSGIDPSKTVTVQVLGLRSDTSDFDTDCITTRPEPNETNNHEVLVIRRRRLGFVDGRILYLPLPLKESCTDVACSPDQTCVAGACVPLDIDPKTLPDYNPRLAFGTTNTCFNADLCLPQGATYPAILDDAATCSFHIDFAPNQPKPAPGELNVRAFYNSFGSEVLDSDLTGTPLDQQEGFSFIDPNDATRFRLAPNLCNTNYNGDENHEPRIMAVEAGPYCTAKRGFQPLCDTYTPPNPRSGSGANAAPNGGAGLCTIASLTPVQSVVYVLMDNSFRMYPFYGAGGLQFAIGLPLASPIAKRARIAFSQFPANPAQCGTNAYAVPQVAFGGVDDVRGPIGTILGTNLPQNQPDPPQVALEAALQGAYQAVRTAPLVGTDTFAQRAVVVISNRDIAVGACMGVPSALQLAQDATQGPNPIATYAVALGDPNEDNPTADASTVASATALAQAGKTRVFNGVEDVAAGATAVSHVLTDVGSCVYTVNRLDLGQPGAAALPQGSYISYVNPVDPANPGAGPKAVDIPFNSACSPSSGADVSGWNSDEGRVRICGQACSDLRKVINDVSDLHLGEQVSPPPVPLVVSSPCDNFQIRRDNNTQ